MSATPPDLIVRKDDKFDSQQLSQVVTWDYLMNNTKEIVTTKSK